MDTFEVISASLFSVRYNHEEYDELYRIFELWNDPTYLYDFFEEHFEDLNSGFFGKVTVKDAVRKTRKEAKNLEKKLLDIAKNEDADFVNLSSFFKPLTAHETGKPFEKDKAYGLYQPTWLRLYAIRVNVNVNVFVVCGGAIKLTPTMNNRAHLLTELEKMKVAKDFVKSSDQFYELSL
ncbi:MAG: hypothetical protein RIA69_09190 [Cyclobacteriaceae bacterium]